MIGRSASESIGHRGKRYPMPLHGFAKTSQFTLVEQCAHQCIWRLSASAVTREHYPFDFSLDVEYRLNGSVLSIGFTVKNHGAEPMPFALGYHPGFTFAPRASVRGEDHWLEFGTPEADRVRQIRNGKLMPGKLTNPSERRIFPLTDDLFDTGAWLFPNVLSRTVRYGSGTGSLLSIAFEGFSALTLWKRPGGAFICIEPWLGLPDEEGFTGELVDKSWLVTLPGGADYRASVAIEVMAA